MTKSKTTIFLLGDIHTPLHADPHPTSGPRFTPPLTPAELQATTGSAPKLLLQGDLHESRVLAPSPEMLAFLKTLPAPNWHEILGRGHEGQMIRRRRAK